MAAVWLAVLSLSVSAMSLPQVKENELQSLSSALQDDQEGLEEKRATWLDTRDLESDFKDLVYMAIMELENEGKISPGVVAAAAQNKVKRGRWQGFCFRKTKSGRFLPYICWKGGK